MEIVADDEKNGMKSIIVACDTEKVMSDDIDVLLHIYWNPLQNLMSDDIDVLLHVYWNSLHNLMSGNIDVLLHVYWNPLHNLMSVYEQ